MRAIATAPLYVASLATVVLVAACNKQAASTGPESAPSSPPVAVVGGVIRHVCVLIDIWTTAR